MRRRIAALATIFGLFLLVVVRGRGSGPIPLKVALKAATGGAFYHWRAFSIDGTPVLRSEGWCALRRSRSLRYSASPKRVDEERRSPSGVYRRKSGGRGMFDPRADVTGMEVGNDFLTRAVIRLTGLDERLIPLGNGRWQGGKAIYSLEPRTTRILGIDTPGERIVIDYPLALSSDVFEAPR